MSTMQEKIEAAQKKKAEQEDQETDAIDEMLKEEPPSVPEQPTEEVKETIERIDEELKEEGNTVQEHPEDSQPAKEVQSPWVKVHTPKIVKLTHPDMTKILQIEVSVKGTITLNTGLNQNHILTPKLFEKLEAIIKTVRTLSETAPSRKE